MERVRFHVSNSVLAGSQVTTLPCGFSFVIIVDFECGFISYILQLLAFSQHKKYPLPLKAVCGNIVIDTLAGIRAPRNAICRRINWPF